jgi:hypothetical protein
MKLITFILFCSWNLTLNAQQPYNTLLGSYSGVNIYSNGSTSFASNDYNYYNNTNTGMKWQCVEYVNRYYLIVYNKNIRIPGTNAVDYYSTASQRMLYCYSNNSNVAPIVGDILCFGGGLGHVAIIREVGSNYVKIAQQNGLNTTSDLNFTLTMNIVNGNYNISASNLSSSLYVQGWLKNTQIEQIGLAKISQGVTISPSLVTVGANFQSTFTLQETLGASITYESIVCAIVQNNSHIVDMEVKNNIAIPANGSYQYSSTQQWRITDPSGAYQAVARWKDYNGNWYDFTTTGSGVNNKSFTVSTGQIVLGLNPSSEIDFGNVVVGQNKILTLKVTNQSNSTANLTLSLSNLTNPFELINNSSINISPGSEHIFSIRFTPQNSQSYNQILYLTHNATNWSSPWSIQLKGIGTQSSSQQRAITISGQGPLSQTGIHYSIPISVTPPDKNGNSNGQTSFIRYYNDGTQVSMTAPEFYSLNQPFVQWLKNGTVFSNNRTTNFTVNGDDEFTAVYGYSVSVSSNPTNGGTVSGGGNFKSGTNITVSAVVKQGFTFVNWTESGGIVSTNSNYGFTLSMNRNLIANFSQGSGLPTPPQLILPINNALNVPTDKNLIFEWYPVIGATSYIFQISNSQSFSPLITEFSHSSYRLNYGTGDFSNGQSYYWRVKAINSIGQSEWSSIFKFTTASLLPTISLDKSELNFGEQQINTASSEQSYNINGINITSYVTVTPQSGVQISKTSGSGFTSSSITLIASGGTVNQTIFVRFYPTAIQNYNVIITHTSSGATTQNLKVIGVGIPGPIPLIVLNKSQLVFIEQQINTYSTEQSYLVTGSNLNSYIVVTPQSGFQISKTSGSGFTSSSIVLIESGGTVSQTVFVRFYPTAIQNYNAFITHTSSGATTKTLNLQGIGIPSPIPLITLDKTQLLFSDQQLNSYSAEQSYLISGNNLKSNIVVTPQSGFQVSKTSGSGFTSSSISLIASGGTVNQTVFVRFYPTAFQNYNMNIIHTSTEAITKNLIVIGKCINTAIENDDYSTNPKYFILMSNYPNPFNSSTTIEYSIPQIQFVTLKVYDQLGREVATLVNEEKTPGKYEVTFNGGNLPSGVYLYRMQAGNYSETKKLILLK